MNLAKRIKFLRTDYLPAARGRKKKLTQREFASELGVQQTAITHWENGCDPIMPDRINIQIMASLMDLDIETFVDTTDQEFFLALEFKENVPDPDVYIGKSLIWIMEFEKEEERTLGNEEKARLLIMLYRSTIDHLKKSPTATDEDLRGEALEKIPELLRFSFSL